jgi:hypothetical protein
LQAWNRLVLLWQPPAQASARMSGADEWVTQLLRQGDAKVFKKYPQTKLRMKREALKRMNRKAKDG